MSKKILILIVISTLTYSCRWDTRKDYKYIGYSSNLKTKPDTLIFKTINDTLAYIKAYEYYCESESYRFNLFDENGLEISKTTTFNTKSLIENEFKRKVKERKEAYEASTKIKVRTIVKDIKSESKDKEVDISVNETSNQTKVLKFKSKEADIERPGETTKTIKEVNYHTFDFNKKQVIYEGINSNGEKTRIIYTMKSFYKDGVTNVIIVNQHSVKEIWFSNVVNNLGYDMDDGSRLAFYGITRIN